MTCGASGLHMELHGVVGLVESQGMKKPVVWPSAVWEVTLSGGSLWSDINNVLWWSL